MVYVQQEMNPALERRKRGPLHGFCRGPGKHNQGTYTLLIPILGDILDDLLDL